MTEEKKEVVEDTISVSKAQELMERVANNLAEKLLGSADAIKKQADDNTVPTWKLTLVEDVVVAADDAQKAKAAVIKYLIAHPDIFDRVTGVGAHEATVNEADAIKVSESEKIEKRGTVVVPIEEVSSETEQPNKEKTVMASDKVEVKAEVSQNEKGANKGDLVSGFQNGENTKQNKGEVSAVPGRVITEGPSLDTLPKSEKSGYKTDYESLAKAADKEIEALKRGKGMLQEKSKLASVLFEARKVASDAEGLRMLESFVEYAKKKKLSPKAKGFIGKKMEKLVGDEKKDPKEAAGQAFGMAREKFGEAAVPEKKE